jgi:DNA-binding response OmpR family regulator
VSTVATEERDDDTVATEERDDDTVATEEREDDTVATYSPASLEGMAPPVLDDDGLLRFAGRWVALSPVQARVVAVLIERFGQTVTTYAELREAAWGASARSPQALATLVKRLRRRIEPIGLDVLTIRLRGYVLDVRRPRAAG